MRSTKTPIHPLQTHEWAQFRREWGNEVLETKYGVVTIHRIPVTGHGIGMFIKGPRPSQQMLTDLKEIAQKHNLIFIKLEPNFPVSTNHQSLVTSHSREKLLQLLRSNGCVEGKTLFTPTTFWIDLRRPEIDILKSFSGKTRYNIRLAQKHGVKISEDDSDKAFEKYLELTFETTNRQGFYAHTPKYHRLMWKHLHRTMITERRSPIAHLLVAKYKSEIITTWILFVYDKVLYYPYGASSDKYKSVMANNLMMWEAIQFGKHLGCKAFDLWGREPGKGFTKFKEGYNPEVVGFLGSWDLVTSPLYKIYKIAEFLRWLILKTQAKLNLTT